MTPTTQEELQAFYAQVMPGFMEYVRSHQSAIEQVEIATSKTGIFSFPATQSLGGVLKTVRVPLSLITADVDAEAAYAKAQGDYAKAQGDYAKNQGNYAKNQGDYANEKGTYANTQGAAALAAKNTVMNWYTPFHDSVEAWAAQAASNETTRQSNEQTRISQETARETRATSDHNTAVSDHSIAQSDHSTATTDHNTAATDHETAVADHTQATEDHSVYESDHEISEAQQTTFEANEAQRQQDFEDAEDERMKAALLTRFYIDPETMELHALQVENDDITYSVNDEGDMIASFEAA